jgi:predicted amidohydrolase YtcJ
MNHNLILWNGKIHTLDPAGTRAEALAVKDGKILRVGKNQEIEGLPGEGWERIDLQGKTVLPGFIDSHVHLTATASTAIGINLADVRSVGEVLAKVDARVKTTPPGEWIHGYFITHLSDRAMPTRYDLDRVSSGRPVQLFHRDGHLCSVNTKAFEILRVPTDREGVEMVSGEPTGVVRDPAILSLPRPDVAMSEEAKTEALRLATGRALERGVTTIHSLDGGPRRQGVTALILKVRDQLSVKIVSYHQSMDVQESLDLGLPRIGGCIAADGAFEAHTAALLEPYADEPDHYGALTYSQEEMNDFAGKANRAGLQIAVHCEGDRAVEQVLFAYEKALREFPRRNHRHRIEHFEIPTENQIERVAKAGIVAGMQPAFLPAFFYRGGTERYESFLGWARLKWIHPYRTLLDQGVLVAGGSDSPVTEINPLAGIQAAATHPHSEQRATVLEAIEMFTTSGAAFAFEEDRKGSIELGKAADLVILSEDPFGMAPEKIGDITIEMTLVDGEIAFRKQS